jgi:hypothetical protein
MDWESIVVQIIINVVLPALLAGLGLLIHAAFELLKRQKFIKDSELVQSRLNAVRDLLKSDILYAAEEFGKGIRQDFADGKITAEERKARLKKLGEDIIAKFEANNKEYVAALGVDKIKMELEGLVAAYKNYVAGE